MGIELIGVLMFVFGAIIGSFLNVCIVRLPHEQSIVMPRSHCIHCKKMIPWYDNIPFLSYLILRGQCRFCHKKISPRYFFVELITALAFLGFYQYYGLTMVLGPYLVMMSCFIVATFVDFEHRIIPDEVSVGGMKIGILFSLLIPALHSKHFDMLIYGRLFMRVIIGVIALTLIYGYFFGENEKNDEDEDYGKGESIRFYAWFAFLMVIDLLVELALPKIAGTKFGWIAPYFLSLDASIIGAIASGGLIYLMGDLGKFLFKKDAMGGGDVKLLAMIGAFMGWELAILTFFVSPFFGIVYGGIEKLRTKDSTIAYGPFIVLGALICLFWGDSMITWYFSAYGLY